jgi:hypothetical protein
MSFQLAAPSFDPKAPWPWKEMRNPSASIPDTINLSESSHRFLRLIINEGSIATEWQAANGGAKKGKSPARQRPGWGFFLWL